MKTDNLILTIAIVAVFVSIVGAGLTYNYINSFKNKITGYATTTGKINLTVESAAAINFSTSEINWGSGRVTAGQSSATLNTAGGANNITNGNWTGNTAGLIVENIGNTNLTINLTAGSNAAGLLGGTGSSYEFNVSNSEGGSCLDDSGGGSPAGINVFVSANTTTKEVCGRFRHETGNDEIRIDIKLVVPEDSKTGELTDTITATVVQAAS